MIRLSGKSAHIEPHYSEFDGELLFCTVTLLLNGEPVRQASFRTWRGAQRVVDNYFKI